MARKNPEDDLTYHRAWRQAHAPALRVYKREWIRKWRVANPEKAKEKDREKRRKNPESMHKSNKRRYDANPEGMRARSRAFRLAHPEQTKAAQHTYRKAHPEKHRADEKRRRATHANAPVNDLTHAQWLEIQAAQDHRCYYCGKRCRGKLTQDHILPLSKGGSHTLHNVIGACRSCNSRKQASAPPVPVQPFLLTVAPALKKKAS